MAIKILIANYALADRSGTETFVRDLAAVYLRDGDTVYVYSPFLGAIAEECRALGAIVTDNIRTIKVVPDVIHGHHSTAVTAAIRFPSTPIVYACHGIIPSQEWPIKLPTIKKYVAVSNLTRARISEATGIGVEDIEIVSNFVDTNRFKPQRTLPDKATRALLFGNYWGRDSFQFSAIVEACTGYGISSIDIRGALETIAIHPELELPRYDIVFAVGRSAIEAMAAGSAVIVADAFGVGGMVTPLNFDSLRSMNFALEATRNNKWSADAVYENLAMYSRSDAEIVTRRARSELNLESAVSRWKEIYNEAIRSPKCSVTASGAYYALFLTKWQQRISTAAFVRSLLLFVKKEIGGRLEFFLF